MVDHWFADLAMSERYPIYTRANAGEVMPDPVSPASVSLGMLLAGEKGWRDAYTSTGMLAVAEFEDDRPNTIGCFGGYLFLNMSLTRIFGVRCPGMTPEMVDLQYFGTMPGIPPYVLRPGDENETRSAQLGLWVASIFQQDDLPELRADATRVEAIVVGRPDFSQLTDRELLARARAMVPEYRALFERHIQVSSASGLGIGTVAGVCDAIGQPGLLMALISGAGDVDSAAPSWSMWEMSRVVRSSVALQELFDGPINELYARIQSDDVAGADTLRAMLAAFMVRFGCRGPNEWEFRSLTWDIKPELVLVAVDRMRLMTDDQSPQINFDRVKADRENATVAITAALAGNPEVQAQFQAGLRAALLFSAGRERTKTNNIRIVHEQRLALRELGRRAMEHGHLDNIEQIFMLSDAPDGVALNSEFEAFIADASPWLTVIRQREAQYLELFDYIPPFVLNGQVPPLHTWERRSHRESVDVAQPGTVLTGIAGCPGVATGRARIIMDPSDPGALEPGDILVAPTTDPAWTPLFVPAAAVVVNVGAQITHAVIVSRELGIPCVVSVIDATRLIPDGATITVDGTNGTVTIH